MRARQDDIKAIEQLRHGQCAHVAWSEGGGGEVYLLWDTLVLFSIPIYGGEGTYEGTFSVNEAAAVVDTASSWT